MVNTVEGRLKIQMKNTNNFIKHRKQLIDIAYNSGKGHIGSALSVIDLCYAIGKSMDGLGTTSTQRDRFVLSKGHAALAWYLALFNLDIISEDQLNSYGTNGTLLGTHPDPELRGVDFLTGSLGQGISFGLGSAFASSIKNEKWKTFVLLSDSELNEGSTFESLAIAGHHKLANLIVILDKNKQQALGFTKDVLNFESEIDLVTNLGWSTFEIDGHNDTEIVEVIAKARKTTKPVFIVAHTILGKGISFMERKIEWHYKNFDDDLYAQATKELEDQ
jgi:transketolase